MKPTITPESLSEILQKNFKNLRKFSDDYINELVNVINEGLQSSKEISIKNLGIFKVVETQEKAEIIFIPEKKSHFTFHRKNKKRKKSFMGNAFIWIGFFLILIVVFVVGYMLDFFTEDELVKLQADSTILIKNKDSTEKIIDSSFIISRHKTEKKIKSDNYLVKHGDNLWTIADNYLKNAMYWPLLYHDNSQTIQNPELIYPNQNLIIKFLDLPDGGLSKNDSLRLSSANLFVYKLYYSIDKNKAMPYLQASKKYSQE